MNKNQKRQMDSIGIYGEDIFNFIEDCKKCKNLVEININGICEECFKELKGGLKK